MYGNDMAFGMSYEAISEIGPMQSVRKSADTMFGRFHPYSRSQRRFHDACRDLAELPSAYHVTASRPLVTNNAECQFTGAGAPLPNGLCYQKFLHFRSPHLTNYQQTSALQTLQSLCVPSAQAFVQTTQTGTSFSDIIELDKKDRSHPFYWRKRSEPAEGMARTRDKYRVVYTEKQRKVLENEYKTNKFITTERKADLAKELDLSERQIKIWFQNRRAKERRDLRKGKDEDRNISENTFEDDNNISHNSSDSLVNANSCLTSCRFADNTTQTKENFSSTDQCRYTSKFPSEGIQSNRSDALNPSFNRLCDRGLPGYPISPSDDSTSSNSGLFPSLDVSPILGSFSIDFTPRM